MVVYVDTREPIDVKFHAVTYGFVPLTLDYGDFASEKSVFERKEIGDFINSYQARYGEEPRLFKQMERMFTYCAENEKIPVLIVQGKLEDAEKQFKERKQSLNVFSFYGAMASVMVRYNICVFWIEGDIQHLLNVVAKVSEKIEEGKFLLPMRKKLKEFSRDRNVAVVSVAFQIAPHIAERLVKKFKCLSGVVHAIEEHPSDILVMDGIGPKTFQKMKELAGIE